MIRVIRGDISTRVLILAIVVFVGAVATVLTLNAQGTNFETQLRVFLNYGVPAIIGLFTLNEANKAKNASRDVQETAQRIEKNTNGNLSALIEKVGPIEEKVEDEGR